MHNKDTAHPEPSDSGPPSHAGRGAGLVPPWLLSAQRVSERPPRGGSVSEASEGGEASDELTSPSLFVAWDELELEREGCAACGAADDGRCGPGEYCPIRGFREKGFEE